MAGHNKPLLCFTSESLMKASFMNDVILRSNFNTFCFNLGSGSAKL